MCVKVWRVLRLLVNLRTFINALKIWGVLFLSMASSALSHVLQCIPVIWLVALKVMWLASFCRYNENLSSTPTYKYLYIKQSLFWKIVKLKILLHGVMQMATVVDMSEEVATVYRSVSPCITS